MCTKPRPPASTTPRRLEHREQRGRAIERLARGVHQPIDAEDEVRGGALLRSVRGVPDDGQNGALDRVVERVVEVVDAPAQRLGEPARAHALASLQVGREAQQEVRQHHPAVAARTQQRRFGCIVRDGGNRPVAVAPQAVRDGLHGKAQVGAGVAVGHRKDVDAVQFLPLLAGILAGSDQRPAQARSVQVGDVSTQRRLPVGVPEESRDHGPSVAPASPFPARRGLQAGGPPPGANRRDELFTDALSRHFASRRLVIVADRNMLHFQPVRARG